MQSEPQHENKFKSIELRGFRLVYYTLNNSPRGFIFSNSRETPPFLFPFSKISNFRSPLSSQSLWKCLHSSTLQFLHLSVYDFLIVLFWLWCVFWCVDWLISGLKISYSSLKEKRSTMKKTCLKLLINVISFSFPSWNSYNYHFSALSVNNVFSFFFIIQQYRCLTSNIHYPVLLDFAC